MPTDHRAILAKITRTEDFIAYLRDEMGWPIEGDDLEPLTFEYTSEELGIRGDVAAKIESIKRLRPLIAGQPWGIFFIQFEPKRLPVVALRRILGALALKKRASASAPERAAWAIEDLLFISSFGEGTGRQICLAHFTQDKEVGDRATLNVLGWDGSNTGLRLDDTAAKLTRHLAWPLDEADHTKWRERWATAFTERHGEVISTSKALAIRLAELARSIHRKVLAALSIETEKGELRILVEAFRASLINDLDDDSFGDMYSQTIAYGLLSARISRQSGALVTDDASLMVPITNPFLRDLMERFLRANGRKKGVAGGLLDFDELGINEVVHVLKDPKTNIEAILRDFGDKNPQEDPVIHFYELFLKEYDPKKRLQRGVFYTPRPVVSFIVRSVHELLRTEFGLKDGLADTTTWVEMADRHPDMQIPEGVQPEDSFVQILDPATGTGTFLVEVIDVIYRTLVDKWKQKGKDESQIDALWNDYVPKHLLRRLHGYELLMAPYAIAHLKIGLRLAETGYHFSSSERARVFLTNALEPANDSQLSLDIIPALAHEARAVSTIKRQARFTVILGNPPYSGHSWNLTPEIRKLVEPYRFVQGDKIREKGALQLEKSIQDDYVKFIRFGEARIQMCSIGILGLVTSHGMLDNPHLRGLRSSLLDTFTDLFVMDLHGNTLRRETSPDGSSDKNVFDIQRTGVSISLLRRNAVSSQCIQHADLWGDRESKYAWLISHAFQSTDTNELHPGPDQYLFVPYSLDGITEYKSFHSVETMMPVHSKGIVTGRDAFVTDMEEARLLDRMRRFSDPSINSASLIAEFHLNPSDWWNVDQARSEMPPQAQLGSFVKRLLYRPFDYRFCFFHPAVLMSPRRPVMKHMEGTGNLILITSRMTKGESFSHVSISRDPVEAIFLSSKTSNNAIIFPLYIRDGTDGQSLLIASGSELNLSTNFSHEVRLETGLSVVPGSKMLPGAIGAEDLLHYVFAILHSPTYRSRYGVALARDFPRVPLTRDVELFRALAVAGAELAVYHLMDSPAVDKVVTSYVGPECPPVSSIGWSGGTVWLDAPTTRRGQSTQSPAAGTMGFRGVTEQVWNFHIGGYQVCKKWLKDRRGRTLSGEDIAHYQKIVVALSESIRIMAEIDEVIEAHGGWPGAFQRAAGS